MDSEDATGAARNENLHIGSDSRPAVLSWGLFWRTAFAQAAPLFLVAAIICFFAYNWAAMPVMAKLGLIILLILCSAGLALWRGLESTAGSLGLLACGLLAGPLLAVFGQAYQTGADPWELFRAWSLFLIPLALVGRHTGLWLALWVTASLWAGLYLSDLARFSGRWGDDLFLSDYTFYLAAGQAAALMLWETAASRFAGPERPFLRSRWLPRVMAFPLMTFLTCILAACMLFPGEMRFGPLHLLLYLALMGWGCYHYTQKKRDSLMVAYGLMSLLSLATTLPLMGIERFDGLSARFFMVVLVLAGGAAGSVKALMRYHADSFPAARPAGESGHGAGEKEPATARENQQPEDAKPHSGPAQTNPAGFQAARPENKLSLVSVYAPRLMRFALSGKLPDGKKSAAGDRAAGAPWPAKVLAGLCAWIAAPFVVALIGLLLAFAMGTGGFIGLLILAAAAGAFLSRLPGGGVFKEQAALCLALAGTLGAGILYAHDYAQHLPYLLLPALFAVGTFAVDNSIYRFFAAAIGIPALSLTVLMPDLNATSFYYFSKSIEKHSLLSPVIPALFFSLLCVALAHVRTMPAAGRPNSGGLADPRWNPSLAGCHAALFLMGLPPLEDFLPVFGMFGVSAGVGLVYLVFRLSRQLTLPPLQTAFFLALSAGVGFISLRLPWFGAGLFALALSRQATSTPLMGLAILGLAAGVNLEYYSLGTSLLHKSASLAGIGLLLAAAAVVLHTLLINAIRTGRLPDPLLLLAGENAASPAADALPNTTPGAAAPPFSAAGRTVPRRGIAAACLGLFLVLFAWSVMQKERLLASGDQIILALRPVDPRSLMQGDYMVLRLAIENDIRHSLYGLSDDDRALAKGVAVVEVEKDKPARFKRLDNGSSLTDGEKRLVFRGREGEIQVSSGAFFFQEGHGKAYERARFALLRVDGSGNGLITALLDERMEIIRPEVEDKQPEGE